MFPRNSPKSLCVQEDYPLRKVLIFGNSGSGKSTLAKRLVKEESLVHLDLDSLAWLPETPPKRASLEESRMILEEFISSNNCWVIEGGYTDLLEMAAPIANEVIFMNLDVSQCIENAKNRPWESHKYKSKEAQDCNLDMLINWIGQYMERDDVFSFRSHTEFYKEFTGKKLMRTTNESHT